MGEVIASVRLTNYFDMHFKEPQVRSIETDCVIDPNEISLVIPQAIADQLGLIVARKQPYQSPDCRTKQVAVTYSVLIELQGRRTTEEAIITGSKVRIGKTVLAKTDLLVDCREQRLIPNPAHPDQPVIKVR